MREIVESHNYCPHGHEMTPDNTHTWTRANGQIARACILCRNARARRLREARAEIEGRAYRPRDGSVDCCPQGHPYTEENTRWARRRGAKPERICIECRKRYAASAPPVTILTRRRGSLFSTGRK